jgi:hypothetical protein
MRVAWDCGRVSDVFEAGPGLCLSSSIQIEAKSAVRLTLCRLMEVSQSRWYAAVATESAASIAFTLDLFRGCARYNRSIRPTLGMVMSQREECGMSEMLFDCGQRSRGAIAGLIARHCGDGE